MVQAGMGKHFEAGADSAAFGVIAAIYQTRNTRLNHGAGTHAAGFGRDEQTRREKAMVSNRAGPFAQDHHFRMRGGIAVSDGAITGTRDDSCVLN